MTASERANRVPWAKVGGFTLLSVSGLFCIQFALVQLSLISYSGQGSVSNGPQVSGIVINNSTAPADDPATTQFWQEQREDWASRRLRLERMK